MCGIAALFAYHPDAPANDVQELLRMREAMALRGPDAAGIWNNEDDRVTLGHRRLAIIDPEQRANQPMISQDGRHVVVFNGEIYNHPALRESLGRLGHSFQTRSDTEVLLHLYAEYGVDMLTHLRGMFAFVLWDRLAKSLLVARDPYGIKPLYYADDGSTIRIASQVGALLAGGRVSRQPDPAGWVGFFLFGSVQEPFTQYQSIRALPAGCFLRVTSQGTGAITEYFSLAATFLHAANHPNPWQPEKVAENVRAILRDSVQAHLTADVPVGAFLSSGVDSGALVGLAQETKKEKIHTVTLSFEAFHQDQRDEAPLAQRVAEHYQTQHVTRMVTQPEFHREIPAILAAMDQPTIDGINTWFVSKAARELGLKVALSGLGGDELFGGYPSFSDIPRWLKIARLARHIPYSGPMFRHLSLPLFQSLPGLGAKGASFFMYGASFPGAYLLRRGVFMPWELPALLGEDMATEGLQRLDVLAHIEKSMPPAPSGTFARIASMEASLYMRNQLLRDTDWASMAHSLEVRTPLVDRVVLQSLAPLLIQSQTARGKQWLAQAPKPPLPPEVVYRKKTGFTIPVQAWLLNHPQLDGWRHVPMLAHHGCHGSRRLAYAVYHHRSQ